MHGQYIKTTDNQMKCSSLKGKTRVHGANARYNSSGKVSSSGNEATGKVVIKNSPAKGTWYEKSTGQTYFYRSDDSSYNITNIYYTIARTVSSYQKEFYIPLAFGNISAPL